MKSCVKIIGMLIVLCVTGGGYTVSAEVLSDYKELFSLQSASFAYYNSSTGGVGYYYPIGFRNVGNIREYCVSAMMCVIIRR